MAKGISPKSFANVRWGLRSAVKESGLKPGVYHHHGNSHLSDRWKGLLAELTDQRSRIGVGSLAHFCSRQGIDPSEVDDQVIAGLMTEVRETTLRRNQGTLLRRTTIIWNEIAARLPERALHKVTVPTSRRRYTRIKLNTLPESFQKDVENCLSWYEVPDSFAANARKTALAPATISSIRCYIQAAATALVKSGSEISSITTLGDLVSVEAVRCVLRYWHSLGTGRKHRHTAGLAQALIQIARDWVRCDAGTLAKLKVLAGKVPRSTVGMTDENRKILRQFDDPAVTKRFLTMPERLWREVMAEPAPNWQTLAKAEAAIAIAFLTVIPIRLQNLTALTYGSHLFLRDGANATSTAEFPAEELKNGLPMEFDIPGPVARMLIEFREQLAPKIVGHRPSHVFVNSDGTLKTKAGVRALIQRYLKRRVGIVFHPHAARHLAGKFILDREPGSHELVKQVLGHTRIQTTVDFYTGIDTRRAARHHQHLLQEALAEQSKPARRKRGRRPRDRG